MKEENLHHNDLDNVELENYTTKSRNLLINVISYQHFLFIFAAYIIFFVVYVFAGISCPAESKTSTLYYPLVQNYSNYEATLKILIDPIYQNHKFIKISAQALRYSIKYPIADPLVVKGTYEHLYNGQSVANYSLEETNITNYFDQGSDKSSTFHILTQWVDSKFDAMILSLVVQTEFHNIKGFELIYTCVDPTYSSFISTVRFLLFGTTCYALIGFVITYQRRFISTFEYFCFILGISAVIATNPLSLIFNHKLFFVLDDIFQPFFFMIFRLYLIYLLLQFIPKSINTKLLNYLFLSILVIYGSFEIADFCQHSNQSSPDKLSSITKALIVFHVLYCILILSAYIYCYIYNSIHLDSLSHFKSMVYGLIALITSLSTILFGVVRALQMKPLNLSLRMTLYLSCHILATIAFLFLNHNVSSKEINHDVVPESASEGEPDAFAQDLHQISDSDN